MSNVVDFKNKEKENNDNLVESMLGNTEEESTESQSFDPHQLEMIKRGISGGLNMLNNALEKNDATSNVEVTQMMMSVQKTLVNLGELVNLLEHDLIGMIKNLEGQAAGQWTMQAHLQTLIETLKQNAIVTDEELEITWNKLITPMMNEMKDQS